MPPYSLHIGNTILNKYFLLCKNCMYERGFSQIGHGAVL